MKAIFLFILFMSAKSSANVVGVDAQNFNPTTNGLDFVTVQSSKTLSPGIINFGLFFNYAINTLPNYEDVNTQNRFEPRDSLTSMDLNMGIGLMNNWDIGISLPQVLTQSVDEDSTVFHGQFEQTGINEIRINSKYRFWDGMSQGLAVVGTVNFFLIEDYPFTGNSPGPTYNVELAYDNTINKLTWGVNAGYRFRNPGDPIAGIPIQPFGNQFIGSVAGSYYFTDWDFKVIAEIFGSLPTQEVAFTSDRDQSSAEFLIGGKWDLKYDIAAHLGMGTELFHGSSSPDWRVYAGINWTFGPVFSSQEPAPSSDYIVDEFSEAPKTEKSFTYIDDQKAFTSAPQGFEVFMAKNILFEFNGTNVRKDFYPHLESLARHLMKENGFKEMLIIGHTDSVGSDTYNLNLSLMRANAVKDVIASYLPPEHRAKVLAQSEGERSPIASNRNYQGRALNRRVEFFVKR